MSPNPGEGNLKNKIESSISWEDLAKDLQAIFNSSERKYTNPSTKQEELALSTYTGQRVIQTILKRARAGDINGVRSMVETASNSYFTAAEVEKIYGELAAYAEDLNLQKKESIVTETETVEDSADKTKKKIRENKKKHKKENASTFADAPKDEIKKEVPNNLAKIKFDPDATNEASAVVEEIVKAPDVIVEEQKVEILTPKKPIEEVVIIPEITELKKEAQVKSKVEKVRMPDEETSNRLNSIIQKNKKEINALLEREDLPIVTHEDPDLDSKAAIYLLKILGGAKNKEIKFVGKGKSTEEGILIDVGDTHDLISVGKNRAVFDHHFPNGWVETSSTEIVLESLKKLGRIKNIENWMRNFANFVTEVDNMSYEVHDKEWFKNSYGKTMLGLREYIPVETIAELFKNGKGPYDVLTEEELNTITYKNKKGDMQPLKVASANESYKARESASNAEWHERENLRRGLKLYTNEFGKILYNDRSNDKGNKNDKKDKGHSIQLGPHAAYNMGYNSYATWHAEKKGYFITTPGKEITQFYDRLSKKDQKAILVRGSMILNYPDAERKSDGTKLNRIEYERMLGVTISSLENVPTNVEFQVLSLLNKVEEKNIKYSLKLADTEFYFGKAKQQAIENRTAIELELSLTQGATDKTIIERRKLLESKIASLIEEEKIWGAKIELVKKIPKDQPKKYRTLLDRSKIENLNKKVATPTKVGSKVVAPEPIALPDLDDEAVYKAEFAKLTKKDLELTLWDLGWPAEEIETRDLENLADIIDRGEKYVTPVISTTIENNEAVSTVESAKIKLEELFTEKNTIESELANFAGNEEEYKTLITRHYNVWALGKFLQDGGEIGNEPKQLDYTEVLNIRIGSKKIEEATPAPMENLDFSIPEEVTLIPRNELAGNIQIKILEEQKSLYSAKEFFQRKNRNFFLEGEDYASEAITTFEKDLAAQKALLNNSEHAPYHAEIITQSENALAEGKDWYKNKFKKEFGAEEKVNPENLFVSMPESHKETQFSIKEFRQELLETISSINIVGFGASLSSQDFIIDTLSSHTLDLKMVFKTSTYRKFMGQTDVTFSGKLGNVNDSIGFSTDSSFEGGEELSEFMNENFNDIGNKIKSHLEEKLGAEIEKIKIEDRTVKVIFK